MISVLEQFITALSSAVENKDKRAIESLTLNEVDWTQASREELNTVEELMKSASQLFE